MITPSEFRASQGFKIPFRNLRVRSLDGVNKHSSTETSGAVLIYTSLNFKLLQGPSDHK